MKKLFVVIMTFIFCTLAYAAPINRIIFFGDSLSDNGNLYNLLLKTVPKSPPYYQGRFSNGPTWNEDVAKYYYDKYYIDSSVYALGGATALFHWPSPKFIAPTNIELEVDRFFLDYAFRDKSKFLYSIWIGGNDYLFGSEDPEQLTSQVVERISWSVTRLFLSGARNFLLLNLPDLARVPYGRDSKDPAKMHAYSDLHNKKLADTVEFLRASYPEAKIVYVDIYHLFNDVMDNPEFYNQRYGTKITNVRDACWNGGYLKAHPLLLAKSAKLEQTLLANNAKLSKLDAKAVSDYILHNPSLAESYRVGEAAAVSSPCKNANNYLFWDTIHPTEVVHKILSTIVIDRLEAELFEQSAQPAA